MGRQVIQSASLFFSPTGTTRRIVKSIARGLALRPRDFDLTLPAARERGVTLERDELLLLAFPVYGGRLPQLIRDYFVKLPSGRRPAAAVVVYGNRAYEDALLELFDLCHAKGYDVVAAAAFVGEHSYSQVMGKGRPDPADEERARCFGLAVRQTLLSDSSLTDKPLLNKGARRPYRQYLKKLPFSPETTRRCTKCLTCVRNCPVGAFINGDPRNINHDKCILCAACIKLCPEKAKSFLDDDFCDDMAALASSNLERKEPITFLP
ncbi:MAG: EFR1 family ferrodoxin [Deltaproteobacteria bacterium]|jgi:ferredoxin|nr:EFR1 family ferrodoxin [Deltaproteobacteria bacterium]